MRLDLILALYSLPACNLISLTLLVIKNTPKVRVLNATLTLGGTTHDVSVFFILNTPLRSYFKTLFSCSCVMFHMKHR